MNDSTMQIGLLITGLVMLGWIVWGFRQYRRTNQGHWLYMSLMLGFGLLMMLVNYGRLTG